MVQCPCGSGTPFLCYLSHTDIFFGPPETKLRGNSPNTEFLVVSVSAAVGLQYKHPASVLIKRNVSCPFPVNTRTSPAVAVPSPRSAAASLGVTLRPEPLFAAGVSPGQAERSGRVSAGRAHAGLSLHARRALLRFILLEARPARSSEPGPGPAGGGAGRSSRPIGGPCGRHLSW